MGDRKHGRRVHIFVRLSILVRSRLIVYRPNNGRCFESGLFANGTVDSEISHLLLFFEQVAMPHFIFSIAVRNSAR